MILEIGRSVRMLMRVKGAACSCKTWSLKEGGGVGGGVERILWYGKVRSVMWM